MESTELRMRCMEAAVASGLYRVQRDLLDAAEAIFKWVTLEAPKT